MIWNWLRRHPLLVDLALVALLLPPTIVAAARHTPTTAALLLGVAETLPLVLRRRRPLAVLIIVTAVGAVIAAMGIWFLPLQLGVALYTLAATSEARVARTAGIVSIAAMTAALAGGGGLNFGDDAARVVFMVAAWLLGESIRSRRAYVREIEEKAERLERERETEARRAVAEEQARIGRELHDVVAHALSVIVVQAGAAEEVFELEPRRARESIRAIEAAARSALGDLRGLLRTVHEDASYEPQPGLGSIDRLVEQVRATGLEVSLAIEGAARPLPWSVDLSAYRIVQEALTNTLKHAGAAHATVHLRYGEQLGLEIRDDGRGDTNGAGAGTGLIGMRERVAMLGGTVKTGSLPEGGYLVSARIPIDGER
jgi:signal transduction histidine kinase